MRAEPRQRFLEAEDVAALLPALDVHNGGPATQAYTSAIWDRDRDREGLPHSAVLLGQRFPEQRIDAGLRLDASTGVSRDDLLSFLVQPDLTLRSPRCAPTPSR